MLFRLTSLTAPWAAGAALLAAAPAFAHAVLIEGRPAPGGKASAGPLAIELRFNSRIDHGRSALRLVRADKSETILPLAPGAPPDVLRSAADLAPGSYKLRWQVLAIDGHITRGDVPFTVVPAR